MLPIKRPLVILVQRPRRAVGNQTSALDWL